LRWGWSIAAIVPGTPGVTNGHAATLDEAEAKFRAAWGQDETGNLFDPGGWRRAMIDWFSHNMEWIEFIIATVMLWLLMMTAIHELDLRLAG
jgi:hypothetical protein